MRFTLLYCIFSVFLNYITCQGLIQSVHLKPSSISALSSILVNTGPGVNIVNDKWSVNVVTQKGADFHISMDSSWGFHPLYPSSLHLYIQGNTSGETYHNDGEFFFVFSVENEYFAEMISIDKKKMSYKECPMSNTGLIIRNISQMINNLKPDRFYRFCKNAINTPTSDTIDSWNNVASRYREPANLMGPMYIKITNNPILNIISYSWSDSNITTNKVTSQYTSLQGISQKALNIYLSGDDINEDFYIFSIDVGYSYNITANPTTYPTTYPTISPTTHPTTTTPTTVYPTTNPTKYSTTNLTAYHTTNPTLLPTAYPTYLSTKYPSHLPTNPPIWIVNTSRFTETSSYKRYTTSTTKPPLYTVPYDTLNAIEKLYYKSTTEISSHNITKDIIMIDDEKSKAEENDSKASWLFILFLIFVIACLLFFGFMYCKNKLTFLTTKKSKKLGVVIPKVLVENVKNNENNYAKDNDNDNIINVNDIESNFGGHGSCYKSESAMIAHDIADDIRDSITDAVFDYDDDDVICDNITLNVKTNSLMVALDPLEGSINNSSSASSSSPSFSTNLPMLKWHKSTESETEINDGEISETDWVLSPKEGLLTFGKLGNSKSLNNLHIKQSLIQQQFYQQYKPASNQSLIKKKNKQKKVRKYKKQSIQSFDI